MAKSIDLAWNLQLLPRFEQPTERASARLIGAMDERFVTIVRRHLPLLSPGEVLADDQVLSEFGLDSMAAVGLVVDLEGELNLHLPEESLTSETFSNVASLWNVVRTLMSK